MRNVYRIAAIVMLAAALGGCASCPRATFEVEAALGANPWTGLDANNDPDHFQFAIMTDRGGGIRPGVFERGVEAVNRLQPEFVMCIGDLIEGNPDTEAQLDAEWDEFDKIAAGFEMPFFYTAGNHDVGGKSPVAPIKPAKWKERYGPSYYHFVYRDVLFLVLNSDDSGENRISETQLEYFRGVLAKNRDVRWTLVFLHKPLWTGAYGPDWPPMQALLEGRPYTVFAGHTHNYMKYVRDGHSYYVLATTGGSSKLRGVAEGEFDEVVWVTMTDEGPCVANILLDGLLPDDVRVADQK